ncbi:uncharacterized protein BN490_00312 [Firmicutes bacterium CAG:137]|nr:uncharacterized protein BN490_00312 [Firmicutes bacterium CAG:137]
MHQCDNCKHHPLIPDGQIVQKFPGFIPQLLQLIGNIGGEIVFAVLPLLPAGDVRLDAQDLALHLLDSLVGGNGENVDAEYEASGKVRQVGNHFISHIAGIVLEKQHPAKLAAHLKVIRLERQTVRADQVTEVHAPTDGGGLVKGKMLLLTGPEEVVKDTEAVMAGNGSGPGIQPPKAFAQIPVHPPEIGPAVLDFPLRYGQGNVLFLHQVVACRRFLLQHGVKGFSVAILAVPLLSHENIALEVHRVQTMIHNGDLGGSVGRQAVQNGAVGSKNTPAVLIGSGNIVHIGKAPGFAVLVPHKPDPVRIDAPNGDGLLDAAWNAELYFLAALGGKEGFNQSPVPPFCPALCNGSSRQ